MDTLGKLVSAEVRAMAARKRWSAAAIARELGWAQSYMARRWDGRASFTPRELEQVAQVLQVAVTDLLPREVHEVPAVTEDGLATLDLDSLEKIAASLGVPVAKLLPEAAQKVGTVTRYSSPPNSQPDRPTDNRPNGRPDRPRGQRTVTPADRSVRAGTHPAGRPGSSPRRVSRLAA